jgi:hypothetical protein
MLEAIVKIIGYGRKYFIFGWNIFDFILSISSILGTILEKTLGVSGASSLTIIRSFRAILLLKLFRKLNSIKIIVETFIITVPALMNVGGLLLLFVYIFAVLCMNLFATVQFNGSLTDNSHF